MSPPPRIIRRLVLAPATIALAALVLGLAPFLFASAAAVDLVVGGKWRTVRLLAVAVVYLLFEALGIAVLFVLWVASGAGLGMRTGPVQEGHYRFMHWWVGRVYRAAERLLHIRIEIEERRDPQPGAVLVFSRHAGPGDSILLARTLMSSYHRRPRIVMKADLQWDPCIDIAGNRVPNAFIRPSPSEQEAERYIHAIGDLADDLGPRDALILFPEGGNFSKPRRIRAIARLRRKGYFNMADHAELMDNLLPPRPGGVLAAIAAAPHADVVFVAHTGLESLSSLRDLWRNLPLSWPIAGRYWRLSPDQVPDGQEARISWLFSWWNRIDEWIDEHRAGTGPSSVTASPRGS